VIKIKNNKLISRRESEILKWKVLALEIIRFIFEEIIVKE
jgi:hypothetical protein